MLLEPGSCDESAEKDRVSGCVPVGRSGLGAASVWALGWLRGYCPMTVGRW